MCQVHELVLVEGRFGLGTHRGWDVSPDAWEGRGFQPLGGRQPTLEGGPVDKGWGGEDRGGGGVAEGEKFQVEEGTTCKGTGQET